jgi:hypothetical protein
VSTPKRSCSNRCVCRLILIPDTSGACFESLQEKINRARMMITDIDLMLRIWYARITIFRKHFMNLAG